MRQNTKSNFVEKQKINDLYIYLDVNTNNMYNQ